MKLLHTFDGGPPNAWGNVYPLPQELWSETANCRLATPTKSTIHSAYYNYSCY